VNQPAVAGAPANVLTMFDTQRVVRAFCGHATMPRL